MNEKENIKIRLPVITVYAQTMENAAGSHESRPIVEIQYLDLNHTEDEVRGRKWIPGRSPCQGLGSLNNATTKRDKYSQKFIKAAMNQKERACQVVIGRLIHADMLVRAAASYQPQTIHNNYDYYFFFLVFTALLANFLNTLTGKRV